MCDSRENHDSISNRVLSVKPQFGCLYVDDWTFGYVNEIDYTHGFYRELNPTLQSFAALVGNHRINPGNGRRQHCELGCGQGFSTNLLAAANPDVDFYATDFISSHIAGAQCLAHEAVLPNVRFFDHSFSEFASEPDLPKSFDVISIHGVLSWVSAESRRDIAAFIARMLKPGGLLYVSYNSLPGWASLASLRRLLVDSSQRSTGRISARIDEALSFAERLQSIDAGYFKHNSNVGERLKKMVPMSRSYLAHEFFNRDWTPFYFADLAQELSSAKVSFVGRLNLIDQIDDVTFTPAQKEFLETESDPLRREALRDIVLNEQFRTDLFAKGLHQHSFRSACAVWLNTHFISSHLSDTSPIRIKGRLGTIELNTSPYAPLLEVFSSKPRTLKELLTNGSAPQSSWEQLTQAVTLLVGADLLHPCPDPETLDARLASCKGFNLAVCNRAQESDSLEYLASPVTGSGVNVTRFEQLFLLGLHEGRAAAELAEFVWAVLKPQGQHLTKDGSVLLTEQENLAELRSHADKFVRSKLPICERLGVRLQ